MGYLFYYGHLHSIQFANSIADFNIIGVLTDKAVKEYRSQPIANLKERKAVLSNLKCVDRVMVQHHRDPTENLKRIKEVRIQGAKNIAKKAPYAYLLIPGKRSKKRLLSARPTEPLLEKVLDQAEKNSYNEIIGHLEKTQDKINKSVLKLVKNNDVIFTHCHSSTVTQALIYAKNHRKKFEVYNTETRPLFQGRKTTLELKKAKIKVTQLVDSAAMIDLTKRQGTRKGNKFF